MPLHEALTGLWGWLILGVLFAGLALAIQWWHTDEPDPEMDDVRDREAALDALRRMQCPNCNRHRGHLTCMDHRVKETR